MKHLLLTMTLLLIATAATEGEALADAYTYCKQEPRDPRPPQSVNTTPDYRTTASDAAGNTVAGGGCLDFGVGGYSNADYTPSFDHDGSSTTPVRCLNSGTSSDGVQWTHVVTDIYTTTERPGYPDANDRHKKCRSYYSLPGKRCTGVTGVTNSSRLVRRFGSASLTFQALTAIGQDPTDWCTYGVTYAPGASLLYCAGTYGTAQDANGCCTSGNGYLSLKPSPTGCVMVKASVDPPSQS
jgi:hypothetical protein